MKRFPLLVVAALSVVAVSVPAQFQESFSGQSNRSTVSARSQLQQGQGTRHSTRGVRVSQPARSASRVRVAGANPVRRGQTSASRVRVSASPQVARVSRSSQGVSGAHATGGAVTLYASAARTSARVLPVRL